MTRSSSQLVNRLLVNNVVSLDRNTRDRIRASVFRLEEAFRYGVESTADYEKNWKRATCNVGRLKRGNKVQHASLRGRLDRFATKLVCYKGRIHLALVLPKYMKSMTYDTSVAIPPIATIPSFFYI